SPSCRLRLKSFRPGPRPHLRPMSPMPHGLADPSLTAPYGSNGKTVLVRGGLLETVTMDASPPFALAERRPDGLMHGARPIQPIRGVRHQPDTGSLAPDHGQGDPKKTQAAEPIRQVPFSEISTPLEPKDPIHEQR